MANLVQSTAMSHNGFRTEAAIVATTAQDSEQENEDAWSTTALYGTGHEDAWATPALSGAQNTCPQDNEGGQIWCEDCEMWLNGREQWKNHKIGKKTPQEHTEQVQNAEGTTDASRKGRS